MKFGTRQNHVIDLVFPIAVFFVFAASFLAVLMLAANIYSRQTADANSNYSARIPLSYISEKFRQNDAGGAISVQSLEGQDCLAMESNLNNVLYTTYIYAHDGMLKELFIRSDADAYLADGKNIMAIRDFTVEETNEGLFRFTSVDAEGNTLTLFASERSPL